MMTHSDGAVPSAGMRNWMADLGDRLVANGYPIIPIVPAAKCPGRYTQGHWTGYPNWSRHCERSTKAHELAVWKGWPGCSIGVACGSVVAFDIDILDAGIAAEIEAMAIAELGDTPAIRIGLAPKRLLVYRAAAPFAPIKRHPLEMLAKGSQFVAYGTHPDTRQPYTWTTGDELADIPIQDLPCITEAQARRFIDAAFAVVPADMRKSTLGPDRSAERYLACGGDLRGTYEAVSDAMAWVPNDDLHYDDWIRIGMALKGALGADGEGLFVEWSGRSSKSGKSGKRDTASRTYRGLKPDRIGAGTIYYYASAYGWVPEADVVLNATAAERIAGDEPHPAAGFLAKVAALAYQEPQPIEPDPRPQIPSGRHFIDAAPGMLGELVDWMTTTAVSPQPLLALGAGLCAIGVAAGQRYRLAMPDTRSAVFVLALAESGGGKDHPRKCVRQLLGAANLQHLLGGETLASGAGLLSSLGVHPCRLYQVDEFGHFVTAVLDPKSHAHHRREIMTELTKLWTSADTLVVGTEYADQKQRARRDINEPCVCVYGSTVPHTFWSAMQSGNVADGSLARFLVMQTDVNFPDEVENPEDIGGRLFSLARDMKALNERSGTGSIVTIPLSADARSLDSDVRAEGLAMKREREGTPFTAIVARYREHIRRVALVEAVADRSRTCERHHIEWARDLVRHCLETMITGAERFIADNEHEAIKKRVLEIIRQFGEIDTTQLNRKTQFFKDGRARADVLTELQEAGLIASSRLNATTGRPRMLWRILG